MSVINKMLKDLDKRGAAPGGLERTAREAALPPSPPVRGASGKNFVAWTLIAVVAIGAVSLALWLWPESTDEHAKKGEPTKLAELKPAPAPQALGAAVTAGGTKSAESAPKPAGESPATEPSATAAPTAPAPAPVAPAPAPVAATSSPPVATARPVAPAAPATPAAAPPTAAPAAPPPSPRAAIVPPPPPPAAEKSPKEAPKVAESAPAAAASPKPPLVVAQASVPPSEPVKPAARKVEPKVEKRAPERKDGTITITKTPPAHALAAAEEKSSAKPTRKPAAAKSAAPAKREASKPPASVAAAAPAGTAEKVGTPGQDTAKGTISIERAEATRSDLATREFRNAVDQVNQGRIETALSGFASALRLDPKHVAARQAMVVLLMERSRVAEAETVLREGLQALPQHTQWAMLLARIQVQAGDVAGAADTLERALPYAKDSADYHGFFGTVLQMQLRHKDAIAHYEIAVRLSPGSGRYLTGLAMSLEEEKRVPEARDAYTRALATKSLGPDLQAFVERKLAQLQ